MTEQITNYINFLPGWLQLIIISMLPVIELRGAIPWGIFFLHYNIFLTYVLCVFGCILPAPFILLFIQKILDWMRNTKYLRGFALFLDRKAYKGSKKIARYKFWGLMIFVAIPLPGTGVWTGCLAASVLEMNLKQALLCVSLGAAISGIIIVLLCQMGLMALS